MIKQITLTLLLITACGLHVEAQITEAHQHHIAKTLAPVSDPTKPGVSAALVIDGTIEYLEANGLVNLDTKAQANKHTLYQVDALAQQFTTLAFLHLIESTTVELNDDIRKYLPMLPKYDDPITISHVLNHTTGLNDFYVVQGLTGTPTTNGISNSDVLRMIVAQKQLSQPSGSGFSFYYSATESVLMAEIITNVSGISFPEYVDKNVFDVLGLNDAMIIDDQEKIIPNAALPYQEEEGLLKKVTDANNIVGATNLYISISDLAKYYTLFSPNNTDPGNQLVKQLDTTAKNNKGETYVSAWGEMTIGRSHLHPERGIPMYWQYGIKGGYGANVFRHPEQDITAIVLGNNNSYNGIYAMPLLEPLLDEHYITTDSITATNIQSVELSINTIEQWSGEYFNPNTGQTRQFEVRQDTLRYLRGGSIITLMPISDRSFQAVTHSEDVLQFHFGNNGDGKYYDVVSFEGSEERYEEFDPRYKVNPDQLESYTGIYINEELGQIYNLSIKEGQLVANHNRVDEVTFRTIKEDVFASLFYPLSSIEFKNTNSTTTGFNVTAGGMNNIHFKKMSEYRKMN